MDQETFVNFGSEVKSLGDGKIGGYLVRFGEPKNTDLEADFFTVKTDFGIESGATVPVYYHHGFDSQLKTRKLGRGLVKFDDVGLWFEAQLEMRDEYEKMIHELAKQGKLGWSSGAAGHLVEREQVGKSYHIKSWPIAEASLTPTPAEPRNSVIPLKSLMPEAQESAADAEQSVDTKSNSLENQSEESIMEIEPKQETAAPVQEAAKNETKNVDIQAMVSDAVKAALEALPAKDNAGFAGAPSTKKVTQMGFKDDEVKSFLHWIKTGDAQAYKAAMQEGTDDEGGYIVPNDFYARIVEKRNLMSWVRQAPVMIMSTSRDKVDIPTEGTAATKFVVTAEEAAYNENEPTLGQVAVSIHKLTKLVKVSEELMADQAANLDQYLSSVFARALALAENYYFTIGNGSGEPQGILTGATSSAITTAGATAITTTEMSQLKYKLGAGYEDGVNTGWLMQNATKGYLLGLTGNPFQFVPTPNGGDFFGRPAYVSDDMEALAATKKAVLYGNMNYYAVVENQTLRVRRNEFLYMANGQIGLFASARMGGAVLQSEAFYYMTQHS